MGHYVKGLKKHHESCIYFEQNLLPLEVWNCLYFEENLKQNQFSIKFAYIL